MATSRSFLNPGPFRAPWMTGETSMATRPSRWKAQHVGCQKAVDNVKADLTKEIERLRSHLTQIEAMAARHEESAEWEASAAIPAILGRARRALRGEDV
jgi:hypothetical protein